MNCGLLGRKLSHSYSPQIHKQLGDYTYALFEKEPEEIEGFLKDGAFTGLNVTIPYKKTVIPYCSELSEAAEAMGAVNTIVKRPDGSLIGHNTDYFGFRSMLEKSGLHVSGKKALVLGSGGAASTAVVVLKELGAQVVVISRTGENHYGNLHLHSDAAVIVNATPVGMFPATGISPVCLDQFPTLEGVLDLIYNPARTQLLLDAEKRGLIAVNGLWMLVAQAKESAQWFIGSDISDDRIASIHHSLEKQMQNIVLIGMPGCGKSTVGKLLAQATGRQFVDADERIIEKAGMPIPQIFATQGEPGFRKIETAVLEELGKQSSLIIATGGGCVTKEENYPLLHQNGRIFWLKRKLADLPTEGRPLSQSGSLQEMYKVRKPLYERFSDVSVNNDRVPKNAVKAILNAL